MQSSISTKIIIESDIPLAGEGDETFVLLTIPKTSVLGAESPLTFQAWGLSQTRRKSRVNQCPKITIFLRCQSGKSEPQKDIEGGKFG